MVKFTWKIRYRLNRKKNQGSNFSDFYLFELCSFLIICVLKTVNYRWIFTITLKIKIGKIGKSIFHSYQHIAHLSWKWDQNWGVGVCIYFVRKKPFFDRVSTLLFNLLGATNGPITPASTHRDFDFWSRWIKPNLDWNYLFPIVLAPNIISVGAKSTGKV